MIESWKKSFGYFTVRCMTHFRDVNSLLPFYSKKVIVMLERLIENPFFRDWHSKFLVGTKFASCFSLLFLYRLSSVSSLELSVRKKCQRIKLIRRKCIFNKLLGFGRPLSFELLYLKKKKKHSRIKWRTTRGQIKLLSLFCNTDWNEKYHFHLLRVLFIKEKHFCN